MLNPKENVQPPKSTACHSCQSAWKPNRRTFVQAAVAAAVTIPLLGLANGEPAMAIPGSFGNSPADCADQAAACEKAANNRNTLAKADCESNHTGIGRIGCIAGVNALHAAEIAACEAQELACLAEIAAREMADATAETMQAVADAVRDNAPAIGNIIAIGGLLFLVVLCAAATDGVCLVLLGIA